MISVKNLLLAYAKKNKTKPEGNKVYAIYYSDTDSDNNSDVSEVDYELEEDISHFIKTE